MAILLTGSTGYLGSYLSKEILLNTQENLLLLIRGKDLSESRLKFKKTMQFHFNKEELEDHIHHRCRFFCADISKENFNLDQKNWRELVHLTDSIIHCAAAVNRASEKLTMSVNTKSMVDIVKLAQDADKDHGFKRLSFVSSTSIFTSQSTLVYESSKIDWNINNLDPYSQSKRLGEYMISQLLPDNKFLIFRPSLIVGDSHTNKTIQFYSLNALRVLSKLFIIPVMRNWRVDTVPVNYASKALVYIHQQSNLKTNIYHLSSGNASSTYTEIVNASKRKTSFNLYLPSTGRLFLLIISIFTHLPKKWRLTKFSGLIKVFFPYIISDTVFDNKETIKAFGYPPDKLCTYLKKSLDYLNHCKKSKSKRIFH